MNYKRIAIGSAVLGGLIVLASIVILARPLRIKWHLYYLRHGNESERISAAAGLCELRAARAVPDLIALLPERSPQPGALPREARSDDQPVETLHYTVRALIRIGVPALPALIGELDGGDTTARAIAYQIIGQIGPESVLDLALALNSSNHNARGLVCEQLSTFDEQATDALPELLDRMVLDSNQYVRKSTAKAIRNTLFKSPEIEQAFQKALSDDYNNVVKIASEYLGVNP